MVVPTWLTILSIGMILLMFAYGIGFMVKQDLALKLTGHTAKAAVDIVGARFIFLGVLGAAFLYLNNIEALTVVLALGVIVAITDTLIEIKHGGAIVPHLAVGIGAGALCYFYYSIYTTGAV